MMAMTAKPHKQGMTRTLLGRHSGWTQASQSGWGGVCTSTGPVAGDTSPRRRRQAQPLRTAVDNPANMVPMPLRDGGAVTAATPTPHKHAGAPCNTHLATQLPLREDIELVHIAAAGHSETGAPLRHGGAATSATLQSAHIDWGQHTNLFRPSSCNCQRTSWIDIAIAG